MANPIRFKDFADLSDAKEAAKIFNDLEKDIKASFANIGTITKKELQEINQAIVKLRDSAKNIGFSRSSQAAVKPMIKEYEDLSDAQKKVIETLKGISQTETFAKNSIKGLKNEAKLLQAEFEKLTTTENKNSAEAKALAEQLRRTKAEAFEMASAARRVANEFTSATGSYNALTLENRRLNEELRNIPITIQNGVISFGKFEDRARDLQQQIKQNTDTQKKYDEEIGRNFRNVGNYANSIIQAKIELDKQKASLTANVIALEKQAKASDQSSQVQDRVQKELRETREELEKVNSQLRQYGSTATQTATISNGIAGGIKNVALQLAGMYLGFFAIEQGFRFLINTNKEISDSLADVRKTTGLAQEGANDLLQTLLQFKGRTSIQGLLEIAKIGGQLGIAGKDIAGFTRAVDIAAVALGDEFSGGVEEISSSLGKINSVYKVTKDLGVEDGLLATGSAINALGAAGLATAPFLTDFTQRLGGVASNTDQSVQHILGLAAAAEELGQSSEVAAGVVTQIFSKMSTETEKFARVAGVSIEEFENLVNTDINAAFLKLLEGLQKSSGNTTDFSRAVKSLGLEGVRATGVLGALSSNVALVAEKQALANVEFEKGTSLAEEAAIKNDTFGASVDKLNNAVVAFTLSLNNGEGGLAGALKVVADVLTDVIRGFALWNESLDTKQQKEINRILSSYSEIVKSFSMEKLNKEFEAYGKIVEEQAEASQKAKDKVAELQELFNNYKLSGDTNSDEILKFEKAIQKANEELKQFLIIEGKYEALGKALKASTEELTNAVEDDTTATKELTEEQRKLIDKFNKATDSTLTYTTANYLFTKSLYDAKERLKELVKELGKLEGFGLAGQLSQDAVLLREAIEKTFGDDFLGEAGSGAESLFDRIDKRIINQAKLYAKSEKDKTEAAEKEATKRQALEEAFFEVSNELLNAASEISYAKYEQESQALEAKKNSEIEALEESAVYDKLTTEQKEKAKDQINQTYARKELALRRQQARRDKVMSMFSIALKTAESIMAAMTIPPPAGPILAAAAAAVGAIQLAVVSSKPLPAFEKGTKNAPEGPALVGEKGWELVERKGKFYQTNDGPQIMPLKKGDKVYTHNESLQMVKDSEKAMEMKLPLKTIEVHKIALNNIKNEEIVNKITIDNSRETAKIVNAIKSMPVPSLASQADKIFDVLKKKNSRITYLNKRRR